MATTTKSKVQPKESREKKQVPVSQQKSGLKNKPTEEQIRQKAEELYNERLVRGEYGTALDDWQKAEQMLSDSH